MLVVSDIFSNVQKNYLNSAYAPQTVDDYLPSWLAEAEAYLSNWIDISVENEHSTNSLLKLFILHKAFQIPQMAQYSEDLRINLNENLKQVQKRQRKANEGKSTTFVNSSPEKFSNDFFGKHNI